MSSVTDPLATIGEIIILKGHIYTALRIVISWNCRCKIPTVLPTCHRSMLYWFIVSLMTVWCCCDDIWVDLPADWETRFNKPAAVAKAFTVICTMHAACSDHCCDVSCLATNCTSTTQVHDCMSATCYCISGDVQRRTGRIQSYQRLQHSADEVSTVVCIGIHEHIYTVGRQTI
jgi:hypothetical protein